jgi:hypothetical protein
MALLKQAVSQITSELAKPKVPHPSEAQLERLCDRIADLLFGLLLTKHVAVAVTV